jgi:hypothetical protein
MPQLGIKHQHLGYTSSVHRDFESISSNLFRLEALNEMFCKTTCRVKVHRGCPTQSTFRCAQVTQVIVAPFVDRCHQLPVQLRTRLTPAPTEVHPAAPLQFPVCPPDLFSSWRVTPLCFQRRYPIRLHALHPLHLLKLNSNLRHLLALGPEHLHALDLMYLLR